MTSTILWGCVGILFRKSEIANVTSEQAFPQALEICLTFAELWGDGSEGSCSFLMVLIFSFFLCVFFILVDALTLELKNRYTWFIWLRNPHWEELLQQVSRESWWLGRQGNLFGDAWFHDSGCWSSSYRVHRTAECLPPCRAHFSMCCVPATYGEKTENNPSKM